MTWFVERQERTVFDLHELGIPEHPQRLVRVCVPQDGAIVLGSAQPETDIDLDVAASWDLDCVRRKSGGGAVLVQRGDLVWIDVMIPKGDPLWRDDVGTAFHWLGTVWKHALEQVGVEDVVVHEGAMITTHWSRQICFAGLGPGECLVEGRKVVGISQKRTREGAMFQCSVPLRFDLDCMLDVLTASDGDKQRMRVDVGGFVGTVDATPEAIEHAFLAAIQLV